MGLEVVDREVGQLQYYKHCRLALTQAGVGDTHDVGNHWCDLGGNVKTRQVRRAAALESSPWEPSAERLKQGAMSQVPMCILRYLQVARTEPVRRISGVVRR